MRIPKPGALTRRDWMRATLAAAAVPIAAALAQSSGLRLTGSGRIPVAFLISEGATVIDFCGPWEVFQDGEVAGVPGFELFTVAESLEPVRVTGGMRIIPDHSYDSAPMPKVVVIPAMRASDATHAWIRKAHESADIVMSVCTGAFVLAATGLLNGKSATTHHDFYDRFAASFPEVALRRGLRFVENGRLVSAGGLTSGIDLALRVVERYHGRTAATRVAEYMEYQSRSWMV